MAEKRTIPIAVITLILLITFGNFGFTYIMNLLFSNAELHIGYLIASILLFGVTIFLSLRIIYQIDRRSARLKRRIRWFEPAGEES